MINYIFGVFPSIMLILKNTYHLQVALFGSYSDRGNAHQPNCATDPTA